MIDHPDANFRFFFNYFILNSPLFISFYKNKVGYVTFEYL